MWTIDGKQFIRKCCSFHKCCRNTTFSRTNASSHWATYIYHVSRELFFPHRVTCSTLKYTTNMPDCHFDGGHTSFAPNAYVQLTHTHLCRHAYPQIDIRGARVRIYDECHSNRCWLFVSLAAILALLTTMMPLCAGITLARERSPMYHGHSCLFTLAYIHTQSDCACLYARGTQRQFQPTAIGRTDDITRVAWYADGFQFERCLRSTRLFNMPVSCWVKLEWLFSTDSNQYDVYVCLRMFVCWTNDTADWVEAYEMRLGFETSSERQHIYIYIYGQAQWNDFEWCSCGIHDVICWNRFLCSMDFVDGDCAEWCIHTHTQWFFFFSEVVGSVSLWSVPARCMTFGKI